MFPVILQILQKQHCMIAFLLRLNHVPVGKAIQPLLLIIEREIKIQICGVQLLVNLIIQQFGYFFIKHNHTSCVL